jgi:hypothetical protein
MEHGLLHYCDPMPIGVGRNAVTFDENGLIFISDTSQSRSLAILPERARIVEPAIDDILKQDVHEFSLEVRAALSRPHEFFEPIVD